MSSTPSEPVTVHEQYLSLSNGQRTLAYTTSGDPTSSFVVIFFHGVFGVGRTSDQDTSKVLTARNVHFVAPTLAGWGKSSPRPKHIPYNVTLAQDITALIDHLYPDGIPTGFRLCIAGGSYGTVPAQMLYGAPFDLFPYGKYIAGCLLLAPFSPFKYHRGYASTLTGANYVSVGPPTRWIPFNIIPRLGAIAIGKKIANEVVAEKFVRELLFDKMKEDELKDYAEWREKYGKAEGQLEKQFAANMVKSVSETWDGFIETSDVIHSDWGFNPATLDDEHSKRPLFICSSTGDDMASDGMAKWMSQTYKNVHLESIDGGSHISGLFKLDDIWESFLVMTDRVSL